jgi:acetyl-CoA C-acetyltransferase
VVDQHREGRKIASELVDDRWPVLVGVGFASQQVDEPGGGHDVRQLMADAAAAAGEDCGSSAILRDVERILLPRGTWEVVAPGSYVAREIGAQSAHATRASLGIPQQSLMNEVLRSIRAGDTDVAMVVGGEARRREVIARRAGVDLPAPDESGIGPDDDRSLDRMDELMTTAEREARVVLPIQQYALIENALGHAEGRSQAEHQQEIAELYEAFSKVAAKNPRAAFPEVRTADFLRTPGPGNRPIAFPYNKWHVTQMNVDQSVALLFCSVETARAHGIEPERWVFPHVALESTVAFPLAIRRDMHRWPAMRRLGEAAAAYLSQPLSSIEHMELYSCFPVAVRVQQRELDLPLDGVPTITGGMAYAGGPLNSFVLHEIGEMARHVREHPGERGLVGAVSGLLTKPGLYVWSTEAPREPTLVEDLASQAKEETELVESVAGYEGPATVATYTVEYTDDTPSKVDVIADTPDGARCVAVAQDADLAARGTQDDLVGLAIEVKGTEFRPA